MRKLSIGFAGLGEGLKQGFTLTVLILQRILGHTQNDRLLFPLAFSQLCKGGLC
jgi:hypothetical protein